MGASYWNSTMNRWPEPGTAAPPLRSARTWTIAVSGGICPLTALITALAVPSSAVVTVSIWTPPASWTTASCPEPGW